MSYSDQGTYGNNYDLDTNESRLDLLELLKDRYSKGALPVTELGYLILLTLFVKTFLLFLFPVPSTCFLLPSWSAVYHVPIGYCHQNCPEKKKRSGERIKQCHAQISWVVAQANPMENCHIPLPSLILNLEHSAGSTPQLIRENEFSTNHENVAWIALKVLAKLLQECKVNINSSKSAIKIAS